MAYTFSNPNPLDRSLHAFSTLNNPLGEGALEPLQRSLQRGDVASRDLWLLSDEAGNAHAALQLSPYPNRSAWRLGILRTTPDIPDDAATILFEKVLELSRQGNPVHLVYTDERARDFSALPDALGWRGADDYGITYETDLSSRDDLAPDPAALSYPLEYLFSATFEKFYEPLRRPDPSDVRSFGQITQAIFEHHNDGDGRLIALEEAHQPLAMGIVTTFRVRPGKEAGGVNMLGVALGKRRRGWGKRLHRHLMWEVKQRTGLYIGSTDASNIAMLRLFAVNGCTENGKTWELEPA